jgi:hypothetical protein
MSGHPGLVRESRSERRIVSHEYLLHMGHRLIMFLSLPSQCSRCNAINACPPRRSQGYRSHIRSALSESSGNGDDLTTRRLLSTAKWMYICQEKNRIEQSTCLAKVRLMYIIHRDHCIVNIKLGLISLPSSCIQHWTTGPDTP